MSTVLLTLFVILIVYLIFKRRARQRAYFDCLPSPAGKLPILGHVLQIAGQPEPKAIYTFKLWMDTAKQFQSEGMFYLSFGPVADFVFVYNLEDVETIMTSSVHICKGSTYDPLFEWLGNGLVMSSGPKWHSDRKLLTPAFHFRILEDFAPVIERNANVLCQLLQESNYVEDLASTLSKATLDMICETSFGIESRAQLASGSNEYITSFNQILDGFAIRAWNPLWRSKFLYQVIRDGRKYFRAISQSHAFCKKVIQQRKEELVKSMSEEPSKFEKKRQSLLDLMLAMHFNGELDLVNIREQLDTFAFAGHDTVSITLTFTLLQLADKEEIQERLRNEIICDFGSDGKVDISGETIGRLSYLDMVVKETLRRYTPAPLISRMLHEDLKLSGGRTIPAGSDVFMFLQYIHLNPDIWDEPEKFDPERFSAEQVRGRNPFAFIPFSGGLRNCIGQRYALLAVKITLVAILMTYRVVQVTKPSEIRVGSTATLETQEPIAIKFEKL